MVLRSARCTPSISSRGNENSGKPARHSSISGQKDELTRETSCLMLIGLREKRENREREGERVHFRQGQLPHGQTPPAKRGRRTQRRDAFVAISMEGVHHNLDSLVQ